MLYNLTQGKMIIENVKTLNDIGQKNQGLMFKKKQKDTALFFYYEKPEYPLIHMLFVFHAIDIIYINNNFTVVGIKENILPFTPLVFPPRLARHFFELPGNSLKNINIKIGDEMALF